MRGAHLHQHLNHPHKGIIPAYAGSTSVPSPTLSRRRDHPRVCGEHHIGESCLSVPSGSSPRMRGARVHVLTHVVPSGIIPAYAGSTCLRQASGGDCRDHPRVCGEHARFTPADALRVGIIPAYAGSTLGGQLGAAVHGDHPRVCGEHLLNEKVNLVGMGSSPRMRGAPISAVVKDDPLGIIPAYAGSTSSSSHRWYRGKDHPRVCGEHRRAKAVGLLDEGSSPRMRGALKNRAHAVAAEGIIPAYAGSTHRRDCASS